MINNSVNVFIRGSNHRENKESARPLFFKKFSNPVTRLDLPLPLAGYYKRDFIIELNEECKVMI